MSVTRYPRLRAVLWTAGDRLCASRFSAVRAAGHLISEAGWRLP